MSGRADTQTTGEAKEEEAANGYGHAGTLSAPRQVELKRDRLARPCPEGAQQLEARSDTVGLFEVELDADPPPALRRAPGSGVHRYNMSKQ